MEVEKEIQVFSVIPKEDCSHIKESFVELQGKVEVRGSCKECQDKSENWLCCKCHQVFCSRYVNQHFANHFEIDNEHCIGISFSDLSVWCNKCESYIKSPLILPSLKIVSQSKFGEEEN